MNLVELVRYLLQPDQIQQLFVKYNLNKESEDLLVYLKESLSIDSEIAILEIEETEDDLVFQKGNNKYIQLFSLNYTIELIEEDLDLKDKGYTDLEIAQRLLDYRQMDA